MWRVRLGFIFFRFHICLFFLGFLLSAFDLTLGMNTQ